MPPPTSNPTGQVPDLSRYYAAGPPGHRVWPGRLLLLVLAVLLALGVWRHQAVSDWIELFGYKPPAAVAALAAETTMTPTATHLFYLNHPVIEDKTDFSGDCTQQEQTIVLGCYHSGESGIYILQISPKSSLNGVMQVTAAHEMLHAAYERLPAAEKATIDSELQAFYDHGLKDAEVRADINAYKKTEPGQLVNEMHSIFGTEIAKLPAPLEQYYRRYFTDRQAIVAQSDKYEAAFRSREAAVKAYDSKLSKLKPKITDGEASLQAEGTALAASRARLTGERASGQIDAYNADVPGYNAQVDAYNAQLKTVKAEVKSYNQIVIKRNALVAEEQELVKELSGNLPAAQ